MPDFLSFISESESECDIFGAVEPAAEPVALPAAAVLALALPVASVLPSAAVAARPRKIPVKKDVGRG